MRKKRWGRFIGISSKMVGLAIPGMSHYIATKMGIIGFMRGLANDVASDGITANAVLPGLTNTLATAPQSEERKRSTWEQQAIKRLGEPEDVTGAILFLTTEPHSLPARPSSSTAVSIGSASLTRGRGHSSLDGRQAGVQPASGTCSPRPKSEGR
jgi:NAD(P)-dependent dehydrogenase (short-subunit alcohol dehydrogenase family)